MLCRILTYSIGHNMQSSKIPSINKFICEACAEGKLIVGPSHTKVEIESPISLNGFMEIYVGQFIQHQDHFDISWS